MNTMVETAIRICGLFSARTRAKFATFVCRFSSDFLTPARSALFSAARYFVHCRPGTFLGFFVRDAARFIAYFNVFGLAFLFGGVTGFASLWHEEQQVRGYSELYTKLRIFAAR